MGAKGSRTSKEGLLQVGGGTPRADPAQQEEMKIVGQLGRACS